MSLFFVMPLISFRFVFDSNLFFFLFLGRGRAAHVTILSRKIEQFEDAGVKAQTVLRVVATGFESLVPGA